MAHRAKALLGSIAHVVTTASHSVLSLVGAGALARFVVPVLIGLLALGAISSARTTADVLGSRPEVTRATLAEVAAFDGERGESIWFQFDAIVDDSSFETGADAGTFFYLARDPADRDRGLIARSALNDASFRQRVVAATLVADEEAVAAAIDALGPLPGGLRVESGRYLEELEAGGSADQAFAPSQLDDEPDGSGILVAGRIVSPDPLTACAAPEGCDGAEAAWWYVLADLGGGDAILLRSPHPPDALPVQLQGLFIRETFDLGPVLESEWLTASGVEVPTDRALRAGSSPPVTVEASWVPTILAAGLALLLLGSLVVGYPVFGAGAPSPARRSMTPGERVEVAITGRLTRGDSAVPLDRSPGLVERLPVPDLALLLWRYGLLPRDVSRQQAEAEFVASAGGEGDRLVIHERDQSALEVVDRGGGATEVAGGRLYRVGRTGPAVMVRQGAARAYLETRTVEERDRIAAEIAAETGA